MIAFDLVTDDSNCKHASDAHEKSQTSVAIYDGIYCSVGGYSAADIIFDAHDQLRMVYGLRVSTGHVAVTQVDPASDGAGSRDVLHSLDVARTRYYLNALVDASVSSGDNQVSHQQWAMDLVSRRSEERLSVSTWQLLPYGAYRLQPFPPVL